MGSCTHSCAGSRAPPGVCSRAHAPTHRNACSRRTRSLRSCPALRLLPPALPSSSSPHLPSLSFCSFLLNSTCRPMEPRAAALITLALLGGVHVLADGAAPGFQWWHVLLAAVLCVQGLRRIFAPTPVARWQDLPVEPDEIVDHDFIVVGRLRLCVCVCMCMCACMDARGALACGVC